MKKKKIKYSRFMLPFNFLRWNDVPRTSRMFLFQNCNIFSVLSIFKRNEIGETNNQFITSQSFLSSDITPTSFKKESDESLYTVWLLVTVRKLQARGRSLDTRSTVRFRNWFQVTVSPAVHRRANINPLVQKSTAISVYRAKCPSVETFRLVSKYRE